MRCPECDGDNLDESLGEYYEDVYTCKDCGCVFKYDIVIIKEGKELKNRYIDDEEDE